MPSSLAALTPRIAARCASVSDGVFEPAVLFVPHPIQNRTADELQKIADDAIESAIGMLTSPAGIR